MYPEVQDPNTMPEGRPLLTDREREILREGKEEAPSDNRWYNVRHRIKERVRDFPEDLEVLQEHYPEVYAELEEHFTDTDADHTTDAEPRPA